MSASTPETLVMTRYTYRYHNDSIMLLKFLLLGLLILLGLLGFFVFVQLGSEPKPLYFQLNANQQIIDPVALDQKGISDPALLNWVNGIVIDAFSFNYSNAHKQETKLAPYFSAAAMKVYLELLSTDQDLSSIEANKFIVSISPKAAPEIVVAKAFRDRFAWQIQVPARISFNNALMTSSQEVVLNFLVWRVPETESPLGITIATFTRTVESRMGLQGINAANF
jgi:hypothetical protein